jgi:hypothetical protein
MFTRKSLRCFQEHGKGYFFSTRGLQLVYDWSATPEPTLHAFLPAFVAHIVDSAHFLPRILKCCVPALFCLKFYLNVFVPQVRSSRP